MRVTSKGQVTIPQEIRRSFGFLPDTEVEFVVEENMVVLRKKKVESNSRGSRFVRHLRGRGNVRMSTDEILALTRDDE
jgi:AbrB family looped-hinge helix DNA binding protein